MDTNKHMKYWYYNWHGDIPDNTTYLCRIDENGVHNAWMGPKGRRRWELFKPRPDNLWRVSDCKVTEEEAFAILL